MQSHADSDGAQRASSCVPPLEHDAIAAADASAAERLLPEADEQHRSRLEHATGELQCNRRPGRGADDASKLQPKPRRVRFNERTQGQFLRLPVRGRPLVQHQL